MRVYKDKKLTKVSQIISGGIFQKKMEEKTLLICAKNAMMK